MLPRQEGANIRELCRRYGVQPCIGSKWLRRYEEQGEAGLADRSRRPEHSPTRKPAETEALIVGQTSCGRWILRVILPRPLVAAIR